MRGIQKVLSLNILDKIFLLSIYQ